MHCLARASVTGRKVHALGVDDCDLDTGEVRHTENPDEILEAFWYVEQGTWVHYRSPWLWCLGRVVLGSEEENEGCNCFLPQHIVGVFFPAALQKQHDLRAALMGFRWKTSRDDPAERRLREC